jgi:rhodanese-related sulfurtransferase
MLKGSKGKLALVNTLPAEDFDKTKLPHSTNIPEDRDDFAERVEQLVGHKDYPVVVYCASEECSSSQRAANKLDQAGFTSVFDYTGGAQEWRKAGESLD